MTYQYSNHNRVSKLQRKRSIVTLGQYSTRRSSYSSTTDDSSRPLTSTMNRRGSRPSVDVIRLPTLPEDQHNHIVTTVLSITSINSETTNSEDRELGTNEDVHIPLNYDVTTRGTRDPDLINSSRKSTLALSSSSSHNGGIASFTNKPNGGSVEIHALNIPYRTSLERQIGLSPYSKTKKSNKKKTPLTCHKFGILGEDFRAARSISFVFLCYAICWTPYWISILLMPYLGPRAIPDAVMGVGIWLAYMGSAVNPFVYYFSNKDVRKGIRRWLHKLLQKYCYRQERYRANSFP